MKVELTIADRLSLQVIHPQTDSFENLCIKAEILDRTKFSSEEIQENKIETKEGSIHFVETGVHEYEFNDISVAYIQANLKRLSEAKELQSLQLSLYKKFNNIPK